VRIRAEAEAEAAAQDDAAQHGMVWGRVLFCTDLFHCNLGYPSELRSQLVDSEPK
jgi:hypothetical protein